MRKIIVLFLIFCATVCQAQSYEVLLRQANDAFADDDYETAIELCKSMMQVYEKMPALQLLTADAYRLNLQYNEARALYKSLAKTYAELYPEVLFWLAQIEQLFGNKKEARYYYNRYISSSYIDFYERAMQELQRLQFVPVNEKIAITRDKNSPFFHNYGVSLLNDSIVYNGVKPTKTASYITFAPLEKKYEQLFADSRFSYSDLQEFQNQIYVARRPAQTPLEKAELCIVRDSAEIKWLQLLENQPFANNGDANIHVHFSQYNNSEIVFFSSDRKGGFGGFDIWYCLKNEQGEFGEPINAGAAINSAGDEICPFFDAAHERLYFSSDWHAGLGGFDIFYAKCGFGSVVIERSRNAQPPVVRSLSGAETTFVLQFTTPQNMGTPVNSSFNDFYYKHLSDKAYFTSNRPQKKPEKTEYFYNSVFYYDLPYPPRHAALDAASPQKSVYLSGDSCLRRNDERLVNVPEFRTTLFFRHDFPNEQSELNYADEYIQYKMLIEKQFTILSTASFNIDNKVQEKRLRDFVEKQLQANFEALQQKIQTLAQDTANNTITIELQAFTSAIGNYEYNLKLAERRIASVRNYIFEELQKAGIAPNRIIFDTKIPVIPTENNPHKEKFLIVVNGNLVPLENALERRVEVHIRSNF
ncbi:MAG: OmpA family protein [Bacteroidetes bacterium]|nr:OmpA family protein [Bacteroidota bacterium]